MSKRLYRWLTLVGLVFGCAGGHAQDLEAAWEDMPLVSAALLKALAESTAFISRAEIELKYKDDPKLTKAMGVCTWQENKLRWDIDLSQLNGPLVSPQAANAVNRLKLGPVIVLARGDRKITTLLLSGAKAYLETKIPDPDRSRTRQRLPLGDEVLDGQTCAKERISLCFGKRSADVTIWKSTASPRLPMQARISLETGSVLVCFRRPRQLPLGSKQFLMPAGCTKYAGFEDLIQSLLWERMKLGLGLQTPK